MAVDETRTNMHYEAASRRLDRAGHGQHDPIEMAKVPSVLALTGAVREVQEEIKSLKVRLS